MNLEEALQEHETQVEDLLKSANRYVGTLKAWKKACQTGHIGNLQKAAAQAAEAAAALAGPTEATACSWSFDTQDYLASGAWRQELQQFAGEKFSLRTMEEGETLISSPVIVRAQPARNLLQLGKVNWPAIRPRVVAAELKRLRERTGATNSQEFLDSLYAVWQRLKGSGSPYAKFYEIYDMFCLTPGWKKENPPAAFGQAIYALHRSETVRATRGGVTFEFIYPSASVKEREVFTVFAEDGRPIRYHGIRFR